MPKLCNTTLQKCPGTVMQRAQLFVIDPEENQAWTVAPKRTRIDISQGVYCDTVQTALPIITDRVLVFPVMDRTTVVGLLQVQKPLQSNPGHPAISDEDLCATIEVMVHMLNLVLPNVLLLDTANQTRKREQIETIALREAFQCSENAVSETTKALQNTQLELEKQGKKAQEETSALLHAQEEAKHLRARVREQSETIRRNGELLRAASTLRPLCAQNTALATSSLNAAFSAILNCPVRVALHMHDVASGVTWLEDPENRAEASASWTQVRPSAPPHIACIANAVVFVNKSDRTSFDFLPCSQICVPVSHLDGDQTDEFSESRWAVHIVLDDTAGNAPFTELQTDLIQFFVQSTVAPFILDRIAVLRLAEQVANSEKSLSEMQAAYNDKESALENTQARLDEVQDALQTSQISLAQTKAALEKSQAVCEEKQSRLETSDAELARLHAMLEASNTAHAASQAAFEASDVSLSQANISLDAAIAERDALRASIEDLERTTIADLRQTTLELQQRNKAASEECTAASNAATFYEKMAADFQASLETEYERRQLAETRLEKLQEVVSQLNGTTDELSVLRAAHEDLQDTLMASQQQEQELRVTLNAVTRFSLELARRQASAQSAAQIRDFLAEVDSCCGPEAETKGKNLVTTFDRSSTAADKNHNEGQHHPRKSNEPFAESMSFECKDFPPAGGTTSLSTYHAILRPHIEAIRIAYDERSKECGDALSSFAAEEEKEDDDLARSISETKETVSDKSETDSVVTKAWWNLLLRCLDSVPDGFHALSQALEETLPRVDDNISQAWLCTLDADNQATLVRGDRMCRVHAKEGIEAILLLGQHDLVFVNHAEKVARRNKRAEIALQLEYECALGVAIRDPQSGAVLGALMLGLDVTLEDTKVAQLQQLTTSVLGPIIQTVQKLQEMHEAKLEVDSKLQCIEMRWERLAACATWSEIVSLAPEILDAHAQYLNSQLQDVQQAIDELHVDNLIWETKSFPILDSHVKVPQIHEWLAGTLSQHEKETASFARERQRLKEVQTELTNKVEQLEANTERLEQEKAQAHGRADALSKDILQAESDKTEALRACHSAQRACHRAEALVNETENARMISESKAADIQTRQTAQVQNLEHQVKSLRAELANAREQLETARAMVEDENACQIKAKVREQALESSVDKLQSEEANLQEKLRIVDEESNAAKTEVRILQQSVAELRNEVLLFQIERTAAENDVQGAKQTGIIREGLPLHQSWTSTGDFGAICACNDALRRAKDEGKGHQPFVFNPG
ncbi:Hypothetical Protein FCC1311_078422 [Hondaea fermentalgiana]|uniref:Uncharacterized protein n=1 Tax=Hondaea fermentalgiana TaxID=2315210 RepID=A0A2R5GL55_9STRA|nr:Hypothetical Protein FCC1311_078422 [Hondaea fermentalgiana]|eukprot:GBG31617.1 Hypothetical Protein FCC1311_078422 [Hondaea fermentalgiana]